MYSVFKKYFKFLQGFSFASASQLVLFLYFKVLSSEYVINIIIIKLILQTCTFLHLHECYYQTNHRFSFLMKFCSIQMEHIDKNVITWMTESAINKQLTLFIQISLCNLEISLNPDLFGNGLL